MRQLSTTNKFGQVSSGVLQWRAETKLAKVTIVKEGTHMKISEALENWESTIWPDTEPDEFEGQIYLLLINGFSRWTYGSRTSETVPHTILLCAIENGAFRRVGIAGLKSNKVADWEFERTAITNSGTHAPLGLPDFITPEFWERPKIIIRWD
jgi:hypothetical protein